MTTSIMMCTYNRFDLTKRMLANLFQTTDSPYRLIVVDNGSADETKDQLEPILKEAKIDYHLHFNPENKGIAIGRNQGLFLADKLGLDDEFLCTIDNDVELPPGWLTQCLEFIKDNPRMAIGVNFEGTNYPLKTRNGKTYQFKHEGNLGTACSVFPRQLHKMIGFFTTDYGLYGEEDADFYFRARMAGFELGYLQTNGNHFGEGELDTGAYREFKTESHRKNLSKFQMNCHAYMRRLKPIFIPYHGPSM
jgi:GT2 family glycosyltransferase